MTPALTRVLLNFAKGFLSAAFLSAALSAPTVAGEGPAEEYLSSARWYRLATSADQGDPESQFQLALLYHLGREVPQNLVLAHKWYDLAACQGHKSANQGRQLVAAELTPTELAKARDLAGK